MSSLWNGYVHSNLQCAFWNWSKHTKSTIRKFSTTALLRNAIARYNPIPQDTSLYFKKFHLNRYPNETTSLNCHSEFLKLEDAISSQQIQHYRLFCEMVMLFFFSNLYQLKISPSKKEIASPCLIYYLLFMLGKSGYDSIKGVHGDILTNI